MKLLELLNLLKSRNIQLGLAENNQLKIHADKGTLTEEVLSPLKANKHLLVDWLLSLDALNANGGLTEIKKVSREQPLKLSFAQQRLWFLDQVEGKNDNYNLPIILKLKGKIKKSLIEKALNQLLIRHEPLRTNYYECDGEALQEIVQDATLTLTYLSVSESEKNSELLLNDILEKEISGPFNLSKDLKIRAQLIKLAEEEHILQITLHHISADGWSIGVIIKEFNHFYSTYKSDSQTELPPLRIQYADYAAWQRDNLKGDNLVEQLRYWKDVLAEAPLVHSLPLDKTRPIHQSYSADTVKRILSKETADALTELAKNNNATLFMAIMSVFYLLISKYGHQDDVVIGTPAAGRSHPEIESLIGCFINNLVIRLNKKDSQNFQDLLKLTSETCLNGYKHQQVPFELLVEELSPERTTAYNPLFQISLAMQNVSEEKLSLAGLELEAIDMDKSMGRYDLSLLVDYSEQGLKLNWLFNTALFVRSSIEKMALSFEQLLGQVITEPEMLLNSISLCSDKDREQQLSNAQPLPENVAKKRLHQYFEDTAKKNPDSVAVECNEQKYTFEQLNKLSNKIANLLVLKGAKQSDVIGLLFKPGIEMIASIIAVHKINAVYLPIEHTIPFERICYTINDSNAKYLLAHDIPSALTSEFADIIIDFNSDLTSGLSESDPEIVINSEINQPAYIIYTSGTTGNPKGVLLGHHGLSNFINVFNQQIDSLESKVNAWLWTHSYSFDASIKGMVALAQGAKVLIPKIESTIDSVELANLLQHEKISVFNALPAVIEALLPQLIERKIKVNLISSGAKIRQELWDSINQYCNQFSVKAINAYGPTEATINCCFANISENKVANIGESVNGYSCYILDSDMQLLPVGAVGEIYVSGVGLALDYLNLKELYLEKFVSIPFLNGLPEQKLYKTGDLARYLEDGSIQFIGRFDEQVKLRGYRIELNEINENIASLDSVKEVYSLVHGEDANSQLISVISTPTKPDSEKALFEILKSKLMGKIPGYMCPNRFVLLDEIPKLPSGKFNRQAILNMLSSDESGSEEAESITPLESEIVEIWKDLLDVDRVKTTDSFFEIGGHSLLAMKLIAEIRAVYKVSLPIRTLLSSPNIQSLAWLIEEKQNVVNNSSATKTESTQAELLI